MVVSNDEGTLLIMPTYMERAAERAAGADLEALASASGVTPRRIIAFINNPTHVTAGNLEKIIKALDALANEQS